MIPKDIIDKIFQTAKIEEVIGDFVSLKKKGVNYIGNCPFHNEKTPSFTVSPTKGIYKCFGCGNGGNSVKFIMDIEHYNYPEALKYIAKKYHIEIIEKELTPKQQKTHNKRESLYIITKFANQFFQNSLWKTNEGVTIGLAYLKERGFQEDIIKKFEIGYNPKTKEGFSKAATKNVFDQELLIESGLSMLNTNSNELIDRFKDRVIFPIHSFSGRVLGFGGRSFNIKAKAKYLNSPESLIYYKSKILYGLYQSKSEIAKEDNCLIVEGYTDVISMHQNNIKNVVSASGTALSSDQLSLIKRITENIILMFDGDKAGIKATYRTIDLALQQSMNVSVFVFPKNEDPDSYSQKMSEKEFKTKITEECLNFVDYKILMSKLSDKKNPKEIIKIKRDIFKSIGLIPDSLIRSQYCKTYFKKLDITEKVMLYEVEKARKTTTNINVSDTIKEKESSSQIPLNKQQNTDNKLEHLELEILRLLLNYGNEKFYIENEEITVCEMIITDLTADNILFSNSLSQDLYNEIKNIVEEQGGVNVHYFINNTNSDIAQTCVDLISSKHSISNNWADQHNILTVRENEKMRKTTEKAILALKKHHVNMKINMIQRKISNEGIDENEMKELINLTRIKSDISKILGRNVG